MPMPKFIDNIRKKVTEETVQENLPTIIDLLIAGFGALIFFGAGRNTSRHSGMPDHTSVTNNYYYYGKEDRK